MRAAWYERQGPAADVLIVGDLPDPAPGPGEVRIRVRASGVNVGDIKKREGWLGSSMPYPRVIPHSDGAGEIDAVGEGVDPSHLGERVWCYGAQSYRPFGTAAELVVVPEHQAVRLPEALSFEQGACLGIPGITAHRAVFADGPVQGRTVLVAGAAGAVGSMAAQLAGWGGALVLATVRSATGRGRANGAGAEHVFVLDEGDLASAIRAAAPGGVDRIVEVALSANAELDAAVLAQGGVLAAYSSPDPEPRLPFWPLLFQNVTIRLLGSDDFPEPAKRQAAEDIVTCLEEGRLNVEIGARLPLEEIAAAHRAVERPSGRGRVVVLLG
jgi:NADPH2:quinone reductase